MLHGSSNPPEPTTQLLTLEHLSRVRKIWRRYRVMRFIGKTAPARRDSLSREAPQLGHCDCWLHVRPNVFANRENAPNGCDQPVEFDRLSIELVAARGDRLFALAGQRMSGESDHWNVARLRIALQSAGGFPAVHDRHFEIHQNDVRPLGSRHLAS